MPHPLTRRALLRTGLATVAAASLPLPATHAEDPSQHALEEFSHSQISIRAPLQLAQRVNVTPVLMSLNEDSLLKPFREMAGKPGPGASLGGWYEWKPDYDFHHDDAGLAPASTFGQWTSALARLHAASTFNGDPGDPALAARVIRLNALLGQAIDPRFFAQTRFAGYTYDKLVCGLVDAHRLLRDPQALPTLEAVTAAATQVLPGHAVDRDIQSKPGADISWMWDETYTLPENLYLASAAGAGPRYLALAESYLDNATYFEPLARGANVLADKHAYSYVNALCSAMQAYLTGGSVLHLQTARNGFNQLEQQSFATGGWGPEESLRKPGYDDLYKSLTATHNGFETPCGSYAHMKLTRYLLRATRNGRYGDSMERVLHNTILGALPLQPDGRSFYSSDYNQVARRVYSVHRWPCCSGTLPQVVADYGINSYLRDPSGVWVNLYQPSALRWTEGKQTFLLEQTSAYPEEELIRLRLTASHPSSFAIRLRIPAWAQDSATLRVNNRLQDLLVQHGFATIERVWRTGDLIDLTLPMPLRLEAFPANGGPAHLDTVALMRGPLVLFALRSPGELGPIQLPRQALLAAERTALREWTVTTGAGKRRMVPFTEIGEQEYSTYITLA